MRLRLHLVQIPTPNSVTSVPLLLESQHTIRYGSSLRAVSIHETLERSKRWQTKLGISRVTDITRLDRIGIPVCASIRPGALTGSLCVNAGKGQTALEAFVGAMMEAIEFGMAEYGASDIPLIQSTAREVLDGRFRPEAVLDFCPIIGSSIPLDEPIVCVQAENLLTGEACLVPAELIFLPTPRYLIPNRYFGSSSTGLSSGNTLLEATIHGLAEVIERDITSFHNLQDRSQLVDPVTYPESAARLREQLRIAGIQLFVRCQLNDFGIPWFAATIVDCENPSPYYINAGYGCHPDSTIAIIRAITEAAQSRLSFIHGGRDDLHKLYDRFARKSEAEADNYVQRLVNTVSRHDQIARFDDIPDLSHIASDLPSAFNCLLERLKGAGFNTMLRVAYTAPQDELQVVRVLVPGLENFSDTSQRIGFRLRELLMSMPNAH